jgi:hypothetical protein
MHQNDLHTFRLAILFSVVLPIFAIESCIYPRLSLQSKCHWMAGSSIENEDEDHGHDWD